MTYASLRKRAWRNVMVAAINEALSQKLITTRAGDNHWPHAGQPDDDGHEFDFSLPNGLPARAYLRDIGHGEVGVHVAVRPTGRFIRAGAAGFSAGEAFAVGWLERKEGAWLQESAPLFSCRNALKGDLASLTVHPCGYQDHGRFMP